jgi:16S rRNA (adenine1518-N6/adenine1519-N6)-dimethyltransferase
MSIAHVQTKREIEETLSASGLRPNRRLGQHFLIDGNLMRRLAASAEIGPEDVVLEVGGGTGGLTDLLVQSAGRVICVEMDRGLYELLSNRFQGVENLSLIQGDILESKHLLRGDVASMLHEAGSRGVRVLLVANLPYQAATPLIMNLIENFPEVRRLCFSVQAEVAERITSPPGRKTFGPLGVLSQLMCETKQVAHLPAHVFWPAPQVDSLLLRMDVRDGEALQGDALHRFATFVRKTFEHRRKTLRSALSYVVENRIQGDTLAGLDLQRRPETLEIQEWRTLFEALSGAYRA